MLSNGAKMKKLLSYLVIAIIVGVAAVYFTLGPNVLMGGPSNSAIVEGARAAMVASAPGAAEADQANSAKITPRGLCNSAPNAGRACIVDVQIAGGASSTFVAVLRKGPDGIWVAGE